MCFLKLNTGGGSFPWSVIYQVTVPSCAAKNRKNAVLGPRAKCK